PQNESMGRAVARSPNGLQALGIGSVGAWTNATGSRDAVVDNPATRSASETVNRRDGRTLSVASVNRSIALLRSVLNWAVSRDYLERTPFRRGGEVLIRLFREDNKRTRRLAPDEEDRLLRAAPPMLRAM